MTDIPILVFEDAPLGSSNDLRACVQLPKTKVVDGQEYTFDWHPVYNALGGIGMPTPTLIRSLEVFRDAIRFLREELSGEAIIFMDLQLVEPPSQKGGGKFNLTVDDVTDSMFNFARCLDDRVKSKDDVLKHFNPIRLGMLLAISAARNPNWRGMILFASQSANVELDKINRCLNLGDRILWRNVGQAMTVGSTAQVRARIIDDAIRELLEQRKGPPLWPADTNEWFKEIASEVPHDAPSPDGNQPVVDKVREYLVKLLGGFNPPETWFQSPQWNGLYETLKGLIGAHSVSAGCTVGAKNLKLPAVPLLLAAQMAWKKSDISWLSSFEWDEDRVVEIMGHKTQADAQDAIRSMTRFLEYLSYGKDGECQVISASWGEPTGARGRRPLWIDFKLDPLSRANGKGLLQTIFGARWGGGKGQTVGAYEKMMECAQKPGAAPKFSLCIYPTKDDGGQTITRLDFRED